MNIYIKSEIPCNVFCRGEQKECPFCISTAPDERIQLSILPAYPEKYSSYTLIVTVSGDKLHEISGGAKGISWGEGYGEISLTPPLTQIRFTPVILSQKRLRRDLVTLYDDGTKKIMCEGTSFYTFDLPQNVEKVKFKVKELPTGAMLSVDGEVDGKKYFLALYSDDNSWKIMHEVIADSITVTEKGVTAIDVIPSMLRHERRAKYSAFNLTPQEVSFTPTIRHTYPDELLAYLFFEGIFMQNESVLDLLDDSLPHDAHSIKEFIGSADTVLFPEHGEWDLSTVALLDSKTRISHPDIYKIVVEKGKISNIIHLLTCN